MSATMLAAKALNAIGLRLWIVHHTDRGDDGVLHIVRKSYAVRRK